MSGTIIYHLEQYVQGHRRHVLQPSSATTNISTREHYLYDVRGTSVLSGAGIYCW